MEQIQFISTSPQALTDLISDALKIQLEEFKKNFKPKDEPVYLTRIEVAKILRCNLSTVHNLSVKKILVKYSCGGKVFYRRDQVLQSIVKLK